MCWLLRPSVQKSETYTGIISLLSSCLYEERHGARKSGTSLSLSPEDGCISFSNQTKRGLVLFVCGKTTGQGRQKHVRPLIWPPQDTGLLYSPFMNLSSTVYAALWESWCNPLNTGTAVTSFRWLGGGAEHAGGSGIRCPSP